MSWTNGQITMYLDEIKIRPEKKIFDQLAVDAERIPGGPLGSCELGRNPAVYPLIADVNYSAPDPALVIWTAQDHITFPGTHVLRSVESPRQGD